MTAETEYLCRVQREIEGLIFQQFAGVLTITHNVRVCKNGKYTVHTEEVVLASRLAELDETAKLLKRVVLLHDHPPTVEEYGRIRENALSELDAEWIHVHPKSQLPSRLLNPSRYRRTGLFHQLSEPVDPYEYRLCVDEPDAQLLQKKHNQRKNKISVA